LSLTVSIRPSGRRTKADASNRALGGVRVQDSATVRGRVRVVEPTGGWDVEQPNHKAAAQAIREKIRFNGLSLCVLVSEMQEENRFIPTQSPLLFLQQVTYP